MDYRVDSLSCDERAHAVADSLTPPPERNREMSDGRFYEIDRAGCIVLALVVLAALGVTYAIFKWLL